MPMVDLFSSQPRSNGHLETLVAIFESLVEYSGQVVYQASTCNEVAENA